MAKMQSFIKIARGFLLILLGCGFGFLLAPFVGKPSLKEQMSRIEDNFGEVYEISEIPRSDLALVLSLNLQCVENDPSDVECYTGAIWCYRVLGANAEAKKLELNAPKAIRETKAWRNRLKEGEMLD
jgi:hypothetical protein